MIDFLLSQEKSMRVRTLWIGILGVALAASIAACGGKKDDLDAPDAGGASGGGAKGDAATAGNIEGVVSFDGVAPKKAAISMNADPVCGKAKATPQTQETYEVAGRKLANVVVYVK